MVVPALVVEVDEPDPALGSLILAFIVGPSLRRVAAANNLNTIGDYLEFRYNRTMRGLSHPRKAFRVSTTSSAWRSTSL